MHQGHGSPARTHTPARAPHQPVSLEALANESDELARWLHRKFSPAVLSFEDARDAVQDAFLDAARRQLTSTHEDGYRSWIRRAAYHRAIDRIRQRDGEQRYGSRRATPISLHDVVTDNSVGPVPLSLTTPDTTSEAVVESDESTRRSRAIASALATLHERELEAIRLRYADGLPVALCARAMNLSPSQFERLRARALACLRETLSSD